jgi:hypothetical protein
MAETLARISRSVPSDAAEVDRLAEIKAEFAKVLTLLEEATAPTLRHFAQLRVLHGLRDIRKSTEQLRWIGFAVDRRQYPDAVPLPDDGRKP